MGKLNVVINGFHRLKSSYCTVKLDYDNPNAMIFLKCLLCYIHKKLLELHQIFISHI